MKSRAFIVTKRVGAISLVKLGTRDLAVISRGSEDLRKLITASAYFPHDNGTNPPEELRRLVCHCREKGYSLSWNVILNAITWYGVAQTPTKGTKTFQISSYNRSLEIVNIGKKPTFRKSKILNLTYYSVR